MPILPFHALFLDSIWLDTDAEQAVKALAEQTNLNTAMNRQFVIMISTILKSNKSEIK